MNWDNPHINRGAEVLKGREQVDVLCYNDEYPTSFEMNASNMTHARGYKMGDLSNLLPDGVILHPKYKGLKYENIVSVTGDR